MGQQLRMVDPEFASNMDYFHVPLPDITFEESMTMYVGKHTLKLFNTPGHTASETAILIPEEDAVFTGDNIFCNLNTFMHEALPDKWLESLETLKEFDVEYPADYFSKDLAGRKVHYKMTLKEIKVKHLPELDDEFAHDVDEKRGASRGNPAGASPARRGGRRRPRQPKDEDPGPHGLR